MGTEKGSHGEKALMMFRSQNKADTASSRDGGGVGLGGIAAARTAQHQVQPRAEAGSVI